MRILQKDWGARASRIVPQRNHLAGSSGIAILSRCAKLQTWADSRIDPVPDPRILGTMHRRTFLGHTAFATLTLALGNRLLALGADNPYRGNIGIQLYTLRNPLGKDAAATIKAVADAGYKQVECYGFPGMGDVIKRSRDAGLAVNSSHFESNTVVMPKDDALSEFAAILEKAKEMKLTQLVIPFIPPATRDSLDAYKKVAENCNKGAAMAKEADITLSYHNHSFEFKPFDGGKSGFDVFIDEFSADMKFELDVFWVRVGGFDPVEMIGKLKGRVSQLHLKDLADGQKLPDYGGMPQNAFKEIGNGIIPMAPILDAAAAAGVVHCHVEQDHSPDPLASIRTSVANLAKL
jgi:sugar phosphate isomerase/epimerase